MSRRAGRLSAQLSLERNQPPPAGYFDTVAVKRESGERRMTEEARVSRSEPGKDEVRCGERFYRHVYTDGSR